MTTEKLIDVRVDTDFLWHESDPADLRYVFSYTITIMNKGFSKSRLINRHWLITNGEGHQEVVDGKGVVGKMPMIPPGHAFEYTSGAILETPFGTMEGHYEFEDESGKRFKVEIPGFILSVPDDIEH